MNINEKITRLLNSSILSVQKVLPFPLQIMKLEPITQPYFQHSIGVLIGITGEISGRILIEGNSSIFQQIGEKMYGFPLEGDLLESFAGELGNMNSGNLATLLSKDLTMDITPPTIFVGETKIYGFHRTFCIPIQCQNFGELQLIFMLSK